MDPEPVYPRAVAMTWADPCEVEVRPAAAPMRYCLLPVSTACQSVFSSESRFPYGDEQITGWWIYEALWHNAVRRARGHRFDFLCPWPSELIGSFDLPTLLRDDRACGIFTRCPPPVLLPDDQVGEHRRQHNDYRIRPV